MATAPELAFQQHIADFLVREHKYGVLEQPEITDTEHFIAEDQLWAFLKATQSDTLKKLTDDYGTDARDEVFKALRKELEYTPLWMLLRHGLKVRGLEFRLFYPKPRSAESAAVKKHGENRITFRPHFYFGENNHEIDFVFFLNGLPIVALELKHEKNQTVHDAVTQFATRDHAHKIFQHPFLYLAADTSDVMAATDPRREQNFRWHNTGLTNTAQTATEYPVEFLYREVLAKDALLEALSFFLVRVPQRDAEDDKPERPAFTLFPRYHQSRTVRKVADDISAQFAEKADIGRKYLINHSAGSGKTLTICWLADRLHSLFKPGTSEKLVDQVFILTDRKSLDTNLREDIENFTHLKDVVGLVLKAEDLPRFLKGRKPIIVTTQQKFAWVLDESDFVHPETNAAISEYAVNELKDGELIEQRFEGDDYRLMIVANKFQTGFDQPLLAGMFLDKPVVDFTNNAKAILKAFVKYRKGTAFEPEEPDQELCPKLHAEILAAGVFTQKDAADLVKLLGTATDARVQFSVNALRNRFQAKLTNLEARKEFVYLLARFVKSFHFLTCFFTFGPEIKQLATFAEYVGPQLIKAGSVSDLMKQIRRTEVIKAAVLYQGVESSGGTVKLKSGTGKKGAGPPPQKVSVQDMIAQIQAKFAITDEKGLEVKAEDLTQFAGVGDAKATLILAAIEFARRRIKPEGAKIVPPADLLPHIRHYADRKQEYFLCASINGANEVLNIRVVSIGLIDRSPVHPREVFADALSDRASAVIVAHNHPSGGLEPSQSDINITAQLKAAGEIVGIELLDHIIFNRTGYFSFLEAGKL